MDVICSRLNGLEQRLGFESLPIVHISSLRVESLPIVHISSKMISLCKGQECLKRPGVEP